MQYVKVKRSWMVSMADALRTANGSSDLMYPSQMLAAALAVEGGGTGVTIDKSLSKSGAAADAAAVGAALEKKANTTDIPVVPTALKNPYSLTFAGAVTGTYDGSAAVTIKIPEAETDTGAGVTVVNTDGSITAEEICELADGAYWFASPFEQSLYMTGMNAVTTINTLLIGYVLKNTVDGSRMMYCQATGYAVKFVPKTSATTSVAHAESGTKIDSWPTVKTLPTVTTSDAGKILMVNDSGVWAAAEITNAEEVAY